MISSRKVLGSEDSLWLMLCYTKKPIKRKVKKKPTRIQTALEYVIFIHASKQFPASKWKSVFWVSTQYINIVINSRGQHIYICIFIPNVVHVMQFTDNECQHIETQKAGVENGKIDIFSPFFKHQDSTVSLLSLYCCTDAFELSIFFLHLKTQLCSHFKFNIYANVPLLK